MGTHKGTKVRDDGWITPGPLERAPIECGRVSDQLRERLVAIRAEIDSIVEQLGDRRIFKIQEPQLVPVEGAEDEATELQTSFDFDGDANAKVVPRPVDAGRYIGFGPTTREIDDFLQGSVLRPRREGSSHGDSMELEIEARRERTNRRTDR